MVIISVPVVVVSIIVGVIVLIIDVLSVGSLVVISVVVLNLQDKIFLIWTKLLYSLEVNPTIILNGPDVIRAHSMGKFCLQAIECIFNLILH